MPSLSHFDVTTKGHVLTRCVWLLGALSGGWVDVDGPVRERVKTFGHLKFVCGHVKLGQGCS